LAPLQTLLKRIALALLILLVLVYLGDSLSVLFRARHATSTDPYETITAYRIIAIGEKGNKTEYDIDQVNPTQTGECVHALFPHKSDPPCWYLQHKFAQPIPMTVWFRLDSWFPPRM
jgi:hypothetical protein